MCNLDRKIWVRVVVAILFAFSLLSCASKSETDRGEGKVVAKIYEYSPQEGRGKLVGTVSYEKGVMRIDSEDQSLKEIFSQPYKTLASEREGDVFITKVVTYQPNTYEHVKALVLDLQVKRCKELGYMSEIVKLGE